MGCGVLSKICRLAGLVSLFVVTGYGKTSDSPPNLVFLIADDLGWADVGYHDSEIRTPVIDGLARDGVRLERFYAHPVCSPTRGALLTGRSPLSTGVVMPFEPWYSSGMSIDEKFMPAYLKDAGYQTFAVGKWHLGPNHVDHHPMARGFDHFYGHLGGFINYETHTIWRGVDWQRNGKTVIEEGYSTHLIANESVRLIRNRDKDAPMFLYVAFNAPHTPLQAPKEAIAEYEDIEDENRRTYAAMVTEMDKAIGQVLTTLNEEGLTEDTLVVFMSDNGGGIPLAANNGALRGGKATAWEGGIRVPAVMRWPGTLEVGAVHNDMMSVEDLLPTVSSALGFAPEWKHPLDGEDQWGVIAEGNEVDERARIQIWYFPRGYNYAVFQDGWKLVRSVDLSNGALGVHLFRILEDPNEKTDLAGEYPEVVNRLTALFHSANRDHIIGINDPPIPTLHGLGGPNALEPDFRATNREPYAESVRAD